MLRSYFLKIFAKNAKKKKRIISRCFLIAYVLHVSLALLEISFSLNFLFLKSQKEILKRILNSSHQESIN